MIRFHQTFGAHAGRAVTFEQDVITIGRLPTCDIPFDARADIDASGQHAEVRHENGAWHVIDANSRNGTWLNGQRVTRAQLSTGDELELGRGGPRLRVEIAQLTATPAAPQPDAIGLLPTAQWTSDDFPHTAVPPPRATGSIHPPQNFASNYPSPSMPSGPRAPVAAQASRAPAPMPAQRARSTKPVQRRGPGLAVAAVVGVIAFVFAALAIGVLAWRLRSTSASDVPPRPKLPPGAAAEMVAATAGSATYLAAARLPDGTLRPLCTAFAVRADVVATSGHCVTLIKTLRDTGAAVVLTHPGLPAPIEIAAMYLHPAFSPAVSGASYDVGVIRTAAPLGTPLPLPTLDDLRAVAPGSPAYVFAYVGPPGPGGTAPSPVVVSGTFGTQTHFDGTPSDFEGAQLLPHSALVGPTGTGAPVLDDTGLLVGIQAGEAMTTPSLSVRADVLVALLAGLGT